MRKIVAAALAVGMAAMTVTGCSSSKSESKETTKATAEEIGRASCRERV